MGVAAPVITGFIVGITHSFSGAFLVAGMVLMVGIVSYVFVLGPIEPIPDPDTVPLSDPRACPTMSSFAARALWMAPARPGLSSDCASAAGRIAEIGKSLPADGAQIVDADGRYLAPGFIDAHCHDDLICLREPDRVEKIAQGVTTLVVGNCSFSLYPKTPDSAEILAAAFFVPAGRDRCRRSFRQLLQATAMPCMRAASRSTSFRWSAMPRCGCR